MLERGSRILEEHQAGNDIAALKAKLAIQPVPQVAIAVIEGPVWLQPSSLESELFSEKPQDSPIIAFLGFSAEMLGKTDRAQWQIADVAGRISRMLPLFLAEQVWLNTNARASVLVPTVTTAQRAFLLSGVAWRDEDAVQYSSLGGMKCNFVVVTHLKCEGEQWTAEARLIRSDNHELVGQDAASFQLAKPEEAIPELAKRLISRVAELKPVTRQECSSLYSVPADANFPYYLLRLEQLLAAMKQWMASNRLSCTASVTSSMAICNCVLTVRRM